MDSIVIAKFRMEGASQYIPLPNKYDFSVYFSQHFNRWTYFRYNWRTDKNRMHRRIVKPLYVKVRFK